MQQIAEGNDKTSLTHEEKVLVQVAEGLNLVGGVKAAVTEFHLDAGRFPANNAESGLAEPLKISGRFTNSVTVVSGAIVIEFGGYADAAISARTLVITPVKSGDAFIWTCQSEYIESRFLPATCTGL